MAEPWESDPVVETEEKPPWESDPVVEEPRQEAPPQPSRILSANVPPEAAKEITEKFDVEHPILAGVAKAVGGMVPTSFEQVKQMTTLPRVSDFETEQLPQSEELGAEWRGERGLERQAEAITGTALQALPLIHTLFGTGVGARPMARRVPSLRETLFGPEENLTETKATESVVNPIVEQTNRGLEQLERTANAEQISEPTRTNVNVQQPERAITGETTGGEMPTTEGGTGVPARGQGQEVPARQGTEEVTPTVPQIAQPKEAPSQIPKGGEELPQVGRPEEPPVATTAEPPTTPPVETQPVQPEPQPDVVTGIANKVTTVERERRGLPEAEEPGKRSWQQAMDEAQARDAEGPTLVEELKNNPRALYDTEDALLLREQIKAQQAHDAAVKEVNENPNDAAARDRLEAARDRVQTIYDIDKQTGTIASRGFNARKMLADQDFTLAKMEATLRAEGGGKPLTEEKARQVSEIHKKIQRTEESYQKQIKKGIEEYQRRTGEKDVSPLRPPRRVATDPETIRLLNARDKARTEYHDMLAKERFNNAPLYQKFGHYASEIGVGLSRSIKSAFDLSGLLRQGGLIVSGRPIIGARSVPSMLKAFASEEGQTAAMQEIVSRDTYNRMRRAKLEITEPGGRMSAREEVFRSELAEKIPGVVQSERAYTTVLNKLRADTFDALVGLSEKMTGRKLTPGEDRIIANYVNIASGRGSMGRFAAAANAASKFLWSPRLAVSRIQWLTGQPIWGNLKAGGAPAVRMLIAAEYARTLTGVAVMAGLAKAAGADIELDPRSGNFGIRFGNTRIDITAGLKGYINLFSRLITNKLKTQKGQIKELGSDIVTPGPWELTGRFARGKLAPAWGSGVNVLEGSTPTGEPTTPINELLGFYAPLSPQDVGDALKTEGIDKKIALSLLAIGGMSTQNYDLMNSEQRKAIKTRLEQRDQALLRGDINQAYRLTFPPKQSPQAGVTKAPTYGGKSRAPKYR